MKVLIASEHAGYELKQQLAEYLRSKGYDVETAGAPSSEPMDYPPIAAAAAAEVAGKKHDLGIIICGTGIGVCIAASKVPGAIVGLATNEYMARMARAHNNANILAIGSRVVGLNLAYEIVVAFLTAKFEGGRHERRYNEILEIENEYLQERT